MHEISWLCMPSPGRLDGSSIGRSVRRYRDVVDDPDYVGRIRASVVVVVVDSRKLVVIVLSRLFIKGLVLILCSGTSVASFPPDLYIATACERRIQVGTIRSWKCGGI
jgi:hypothetical protein